MQAIYKNYFVDFTPFKSEPTCATKLGEIPASWSVCKFCDLCDLLNGRAYSQEELLDSGKYRVLRVGNFFTKNSWYYSDMELEDNKYCYPDDLLFCWSASFGLYIWNDVKTIYHYHIWKIDFSKTAPYYREYIFLYLKQELNKLSKEGHGSVMAHLTKSGVENLDIVSPPEEIIKQFHNSIIPFIEHKKLVERIDERNSDGKISTLIGVSIDKCFINSVANINGTDLTKYKIIRRDDFAVSLMQVSRDSKIPIARLKDYDQAIMSPAYPIFRVRDTSVILPEYLEMWFMRPEFDREAAFIAVGGVRGSMPWEEFAKMRLPVPSLEKQHQVVRAYQIVADRIAIKRRINDNLAA